MYTVHAHCSGFAIPCVYAILPNKTAETHAAMWAAIRANIGQEAADVDRMVAIDFEDASIGTAPEAFHGVRFAGSYFHLAQSVCRQVQKLGLHRIYDADAEFQLRPKMISALAFLPVGEVAAGFELLDTLSAEEEKAICAFFETNYLGRRVGGARRHPMSGLELRNVRNRMEAGAMRNNNSVEAPRAGFSTGVSDGNHQPLWTYVEDMHSQKNITEKDLSAVDLGSVKPEGKKKAMRNQRLWALVTRYLEDSDATRLLRCAARNYL